MKIPATHRLAFDRRASRSSPIYLALQRCCSRVASRFPCSCRDCCRLPLTNRYFLASSRRCFVYCCSRVFARWCQYRSQRLLLTVAENMVTMISDTCGYVPFLLLLLLVPYIESGKSPRIMLFVSRCARTLVHAVIARSNRRATKI